MELVLVPIPTVSIKTSIEYYLEMRMRTIDVELSVDLDHCALGFRQEIDIRITTLLQH